MTCVGCWIFQLAPGFAVSVRAADPPSSKSSPPPRTPSGGSGQPLPANLEALFRKLDDLGRPSVREAKFVKVTFTTVGREGYDRSKLSWALGEINKTVTLLEDDLVPWVYRRRGRTTIPSTWGPADVTIKRIEDADFPAYCEKMSQPEPASGDESARRIRMLRAPGPSQRFLVAHAAWKRGLTQQAARILATEPKYREDFSAYRQDVLEDLAWLHFLRAVNLLMFADRKDVLKHLILVSRISPQGKFAAQADELAGRIGRLIANAAKAPSTLVNDKRPEDEPARLLLSQLIDLHCSQMSQPGSINPWLAMDRGQPVLLPPTRLLANMGMKAVPVLIEALEDQTPTRTVYHWRDFYHARQVWRVSDFAWVILREITKRNFGEQPVTGFTFSEMPREEQRRVIAEIKGWYAKNKEQTPDERMLGFFSGPDPKDWTTAGLYFLRKKDPRAVMPLLQKIPSANSFVKGDLCELVAKFKDQSAKPVIQTVLTTAQEPSDRMHAAIALCELGDNSGVPLAIQYLKQKDQPYGNWEEPIWFLMRTRNAEAMTALRAMVIDAPPRRAAEIVATIEKSITGELWGRQREPAGCIEVCAVLIAAMDRAEPSGAAVNNNPLRIKDLAARAFATMRQGQKESRVNRLNPALFDELQVDAHKRDAQIDSLKQWYREHNDRLQWNSRSQQLFAEEK
jgi:hypothetical protein